MTVIHAIYLVIAINCQLRIGDVIRIYPQTTHATLRKSVYDAEKPELKTLEWWIPGLRLNPLFFLISRLNIACSPLIFNLQINYPIRIKDIPF